MQDAFSKGSLLFHLLHMSAEELLPGAGFSPIPLHNILAGAYGADLPRIQRASSGTVYAMGTINLTDRKKMPDIALPPLVSSNSPVVMLGAHSYLQILSGQINVMAAVNFNGRRIHMFQPLIGCIQKSPGILKIFPCLTCQVPERDISPFHQRGRVMHEIQKDPSSL